MGLAWGVAGLVVGACAAMLLTPRSGAELRRLLASLFRTQRERYADELDDERARMEGEGGVAHEVSPPVGAH
jgi:gas vesicle protein